MKVVRAHLPALVGLDRFAAGWGELCGILAACISGGRKGVAIAATQFVASVLPPHVASGALAAGDCLSGGCLQCLHCA